MKKIYLLTHYSYGQFNTTDTYVFTINEECDLPSMEEVAKQLKIDYRPQYPYNEVMYADMIDLLDNIPHVEA